MVRGRLMSSQLDMTVGKDLCASAALRELPAPVQPTLE